MHACITTECRHQGAGRSDLIRSDPGLTSGPILRPPGRSPFRVVRSDPVSYLPLFGADISDGSALPVMCALARADLSGRSVVYFRTLIYLLDPLNFPEIILLNLTIRANTELPPSPPPTPFRRPLPPQAHKQAQYIGRGRVQLRPHAYRRQNSDGWACSSLYAADAQAPSPHRRSKTKKIKKSKPQAFYQKRDTVR